jgi:undecaprenyl phosphate-alpha-L-ara4N flippase subunit ArnE
VVKLGLTFVTMIGLTVVANLLVKLGAVSGGTGVGFMSALFNWQTLCGLASFGLAALVYVLVLRSLPLNIAQSFASAQFIAVILASAVILSEPIGALQWLGIALIASGITIVAGRGARSQEAGFR